MPTSTIAQQPNGWALVQATPELSDLASAVVRADLVSQFEAAGVTYLAPTNDAFAALAATPEGQAVLADPVQLRALLERHVLTEALSVEQIFSRPSVATASGETLAVDPMGMTIGGAGVVVPDQQNADGTYLHQVNAFAVAS